MSDQPEPARNPIVLPPAMLKRWEAAVARAPDADDAQALSRGHIGPEDLTGPPEGSWSREGALALLPAPVPGQRDGITETNLVRKGMFRAGGSRRPVRSGGEQLVFRMLPNRDRLGQIERVDKEGPELTDIEFQVISTICVAWRSLDDPYALRIPISLGAIARELGWSHRGSSELNRVAQALSALAQALFAGEIYDARTHQKQFIHQFGLIQEWAAGSPNRAGSFGRVGFVMLSDWLRRQLGGGHYTYYSRQTMQRLRRPTAKLLFPWLEAERFDEPVGDGLLTKRWPITKELFASIGITDKEQRQARRTLGKAAAEIVECDEERRWKSIEVARGRSGWDLVAHRSC